MIKLVVSDLDKTLLPSEMNALDEHTKHVIKKILEKNIYFAIASGRSYKELKQFIEKEAYEIFFICESGALVIYHGRVWNKYPIEKNKTIELINKIENYRCEFFISGVHTLYTISNNHLFLDYLKKTKGAVVKLKRIEDLSEEALKISIFQKNKNIMNDKWIREISESLHLSYYGDEWMDFTEKGVHKGSAVGEIKEAFLKKDEKIMAFGDHDNDMEMLLMADYSFAMKNGSPKIIKVCNGITENPMKTTERFI